MTTSFDDEEWRELMKGKDGKDRFETAAYHKSYDFVQNKIGKLILECLQAAGKDPSAKSAMSSIIYFALDDRREWMTYVMDFLGWSQKDLKEMSEHAEIRIRKVMEEERLLCTEDPEEIQLWYTE